MNKLLLALIASAFAFVTASAVAQTPAPKPKPATQAIPSEGDVMPLSKMDTEQAAFKKNMKQKKQQDLTALEAVASETGPVYNTKQAAEEAKASKAQPLPTKQERQADLKAQEKASKQGGGN